MEKIITAYLMINSFIAGYWFYGKWRFSKDRYDKTMAVSGAMAMSVCAVPYYFVQIILAILSLMMEPLNKRFQINFFFGFYFTKNWNNLDENVLYRINEMAVKVRNTNRLTDRLYRYCVGLVNKRNNYEYKAQD